MASVKTTYSIDASDVYPELLADAIEQMSDYPGEPDHDLDESDVIRIEMSDLFESAREYFEEDALAAAEELVEDGQPLLKDDYNSYEIAIIEQVGKDRAVWMNDEQKAACLAQRERDALEYRERMQREDAERRELHNKIRQLLISGSDQSAVREMFPNRQALIGNIVGELRQQGFKIAKGPIAVIDRTSMK